MQPLCTWEGAYCHKITGHKITLRKISSETLRNIREPQCRCRTFAASLNIEH